MDISVEYQLTREELKRALGAIAGGRLRLAAWILMPLLVALGVVNVVTGDAGLGGVLIVYGLIFAPLLTFKVVRTTNLQAREMCVPSAVRLTSEGYEVQTAQLTAMRQWSSFVKTVATPEFWLLYTNKQCAVIVPKRAFNPAQQTEINNFLQAMSINATA
jgi:hypothetical protein